MRFVSMEPKLDFSDVLIVPKTSDMESRSEVSIERTFKMKHTDITFTCVPIIAANMDTTGTKAMAEAFARHNMMVALHKHYTNGQIGYDEEHTFYSMGTSDEELEKLYQYQKMYDISPPNICIDVANGYTYRFLEVVSKVRDRCPNACIMAGNVVTPEKTEQVIQAGADIVKVGIGPGSVCTTRVKTGVGYPQLSAIIECADAAHGLKGLVCGDGGCTVPGDVVKAFAAGADFVMIGGMLAGTDESGGEKIFIDPDGSHVELNSPFSKERGNYHLRHEKPTHVRFYGMSSETANDKYSGGLSGYRAAEGKEVLLPYRGPVEAVINDMLGGLRSAMTYVGAYELRELTKRTSFVIVNNQHNKVFGS